MVRFLALLLVAAPALAAPVTLDSAEKAASLCRSLQPVERMRFPGNAAAVAEARARHGAERKAALERQYEVALGAKEFKIAEIDLDAGTLAVDTTRPLKALGGALTVYDVERDELVLGLEKDAQARIGEALASGRAFLVLTVMPAEDEESPCLAGPLRSHVLGADFVGAELRLGDEVLARGREEDALDGAWPRHVRPRVEIVPVTADGAPAPPKDLLARVEKVRPDVQRCYEKALVKNPELDGTVIYGFESRAAGKPSPPSVVVDGIGDEEVMGCLSRTVASVGIPAGGGAWKASVAIHLNRK